jgi:hypothetical protein
MLPGPVLDVPDSDEDLKNLILNDPHLSPYHGGRVYFRIPANNSTWPVIVLYRIGGGKVGGEVQEINARYQIDILSGKVDAANEVAVRQLALLLESTIDNLSGPIQQGGTVFLNGIVTSHVSKPDRDTGRPGRVLDAVLTLRSATS